jgi:3-oxoacyl-[acyl-carrier protein] reductase
MLVEALEQRRRDGRDSEMSNLAGKVAVVTGASKGIGAGIAKGLAAAGAAVVVNYASSKEGADRVVAAITGNGGKAIAVQGDVSKADDVRRLFEETHRAFGSLDVLVNNAGVFQFEPLEAVTEREFHREFNTNVLGPILAIREAVKYFGPEGGSVINISSVVSANPGPMSLVYSATKSALDSITRELARELGPRKIRVNSIAPGFTETEGCSRLTSWEVTRRRISWRGPRSDGSAGPMTSRRPSSSSRPGLRMADGREHPGVRRPAVGGQPLWESCRTRWP